MSVLLRFLGVLALAACTSVNAIDVALVNANVYAAPDAVAMPGATIVVRDGRIASVTPGGAAPADAQLIDLNGATVVAGFWNSHVHLLAESLRNAATAPREGIEKALHQRFTSHGFTTVFDIASAPGLAIALRERIARGELTGPLILTVDSPFYPEHGTPIYVRELHRERNWPSAEVATPQQASERAARQLDAGADGVKLFVGAIVGPPNGVLPMRTDIAAAAVAQAHARGKPAFAHPTIERGVRIALAAGVDVLTHCTAGDGPWSPELVAELVRKRVALVPTLALFEVELAKENAPAAVRERIAREGAQQVAAFTRAGGTLLYGTDVGYVDEADIDAREIRLLAQAGLDWRAILASLTTAPATRFGFGTRKGRVERGYDADLVVLDGDPAQDAGALARVKMTLREGRVVYRR